MKKLSSLLFAIVLIGCGGGGGGGSGDSGGNGHFEAAATQGLKDVTATEATISGTLVPGDLSNNAYFEWGTDSGLNSFSTTPPQTIGSGNSIVFFYNRLTNLSVGTTYYYRAVCVNKTGTFKGLIRFHIAGSTMPIVSTLPATVLSARSVILNGTLDPNSLKTTVWANYSTDSTFNTSSINYGIDFGIISPSSSITPLSGEIQKYLTPNIKYYFRIGAWNNVGTVYGETLSFTTPGM